MGCRTVLRITAHGRPFVLTVEPWAEEFPIAVGDVLKAVALHPGAPTTSGAEVCPGGDLMVWVNESGATFEFWRGGSREFHTRVFMP